MIRLVIVVIIAFVLGLAWGAGIMSMMQRNTSLFVQGVKGKIRCNVPWPDPPSPDDSREGK
ncbi:MAG: hypothetical protein CVU54_02015 [Deltaproteobacteria bacterium HGW-Deltaproteobacteria-12]|jgi:hypothetical protein|nr:MAG: hypothetical protein CVU54_02015 [Deltaproteobacteria bacterium HGW-Deltaproteobacteria-12]